jgi:dihydrofolate synthase/folylpolyglutamate synthase
MPGRAALPTLERITALCHLLGDPHRVAPVIHITGTNGKGSTARMVSELLAAQGLSVGTYTSPNLSRVNERLTRNGVPIDDAELAEVLDQLRRFQPLLEKSATRFELLTAAAFLWFADSPVDVAVLEVGLGGRWDATNVVEPDVAVVTNVSYDHVEILGPHLEDIAAEKAGIVKPGCRLVLGETMPGPLGVLRSAAAAAGVAEVWERTREFGCEANQVAVGGRLLDLRTPGGWYPDVYLPLHGAHQGDNAAVAVAATEAFFAQALSPEVVARGLANVEMPGRLEVVGRAPLTVLDGAHNAAGMAALAASLSEEFTPGGTQVAVVGMLSGRDPSAMLEPLLSTGIRTIVACAPDSERALPAEGITQAARGLGLHAFTGDRIAEALLQARALAGDDGLLVVAGSLYVVAEARELLCGAG